MKTQIDELTRNNSDLNNAKNRLSQENSDLHRQIHDFENNLGTFSKTKSQLQLQLEEIKSRLDDETRVSAHTSIYLLFHGFTINTRIRVWTSQSRFRGTMPFYETIVVIW
jgi:multidrug resistance efflux pump